MRSFNGAYPAFQKKAQSIPIAARRRMDRAAARPTAQLARMAGMALASPVSAKSPASTAASGLPVVRLELRHGAARPTAHDLSDVSFLIGSVPGCDLRLPGVNLPPVLCLIARQQGAVTLR